jgi:selenocysteine lyase/cysteine desulfurase
VARGSWRDQFDIPGDVAYLNCAYMAPQPKVVTEAGRIAAAAKARPWETGAADFFAGPERLRALFAELVGGDADGVALVPSVSYGIGTAAGNLPVAGGSEILVLAEQFPSNVYPWRARAAREGADVVTVPRPDDADWTAAVLEHIGDRTAVVAVPNCHWTDGTLVDLLAVRAACDRVGAALVVDASQSLGAMPLDVAEIRPDVLVTVGYKWQLGPYSLGYCWFAPRWRDGVPLEETWYARAGSEDFTRLVDYADDYQAGARRYDVGQVANFVLTPMALAALELLLDWGVARIAAELAPVTDDLVEQAAELGLTAAARRHRSPHLLGLGLPAHVAPTDVASALAERGVHVSVRGRSVRVSPHLYNDDADLERLRDGLAAAVAAV